MRYIPAFRNSKPRKDFTQNSANFLLLELNLGNLKELFYFCETFVWAMDKFQSLIESQDVPCCNCWYDSMIEGKDETHLMHFNFLKLPNLI